MIIESLSLRMVNLKISPGQAILLLNERIDDIRTIRENQKDLEYYDLVGWCSKTWSVIDAIYEGGDIHPEEIRIIGLPACSCNSPGGAQMLLEVYHSRLLDYIREIQDSIGTPEQ